MKQIILLLLALPACTVHPFIRSGPDVVSLGGSIFTKSSSERASYSGPLGSLTYSTTGKDETVIPGKIANYYGIKAAANAATSMLRTTESTKRVLGEQEVSKTATNKAAASADLKTLNPVEEAPVIAPIFDNSTGLNVIK